jgi:hypothetical protein
MAGALEPVNAIVKLAPWLRFRRNADMKARTNAGDEDFHGRT